MRRALLIVLAAVVATAASRFPLHDSIARGKLADIPSLLATTDPNAVNDNGDTPLLLAARGNHLAAVKLLLALPATDPNLGVDGITPLHAAAAEGHADVVAALLAAPHVPVNVNAQDELLDTALHVAVSGSRVAVVDALLEARGLDLSLRNADGQKAVDLAQHNKVAKAMYQRILAATGDPTLFPERPEFDATVADD